ncbi:MAG: hypothetical protein M1500_01230 [Candidatus Marsarchaeota archaeon]|jgi:hypothetical protein|nr:hypothetical protein [Candidatus Marsarchaeota archaeon]
MEVAFEANEIKQMVLPLLTIVFAILAILFFIYYGAGIAFYVVALIGIAIGFYVARIASGERRAPPQQEKRAALQSPKTLFWKAKPGKNK